MIKLLGQITIPQKLLDDVKNREPDRIVKHVDGKSHAQNVVDLANDWPVENYAHYDNDHCLIREYCKEWYKDVIPDVFLQEHGIVFAGVDVIGDYCTEVNITSPTCMIQLSELTGVNIAQQIIGDVLNGKY